MKRKSLPTGRDFLFVEGYGNENPGAFQSTRPLRGATSDHPWRNLWAWVFQPTRPLRGATVSWCHSCPLHQISTHAPLAGRDKPPPRPERPERLISTHAPLAGRDRGARTSRARTINFNPRAPCGARQHAARSKDRYIVISTHAPLAGRDSANSGCGAWHEISTHAPLAGRDKGVLTQ